MMAWLCSGAVALALLAGAPALARDKPAPSATAGAQRQDGLLPVYVDKAKGRIPL